MLEAVKNTMLFSLILALSFISCDETQPKESPKVEPSVESFNVVIDGITKKIEAAPENADLYFERGKAYYEAEGYDEAIVDLSKAIELDSLKASYYHLLADTYLDYMQSYPAIQVMKKAAELFPDRLETLLKLSEFQLILRQYDESLETVNEIIQKDPQNAEGYFMAGMIFKEAGDTVRSINSFQNAVEVDPELVDAWVIMGQLYDAIGEEIAYKFFDNAIRVDSNNVEALHAKAFYLSNQDKLEEALALYHKINSLDIHYEEAYFNSAILYMDLDSMSKAIEVFDVLIEINPVHIQGYYYRGLAMELNGDIAGAKANYKQALRFAPKYVKASEALARITEQDNG